MSDFNKIIHKVVPKQISYMITKRNWSRRADLAFFERGGGGPITESGIYDIFYNYDTLTQTHTNTNTCSGGSGFKA